jgi:hypothetical protein
LDDPVCGKTEEEKDDDYAVAPNLTDTSFETPGSCIVTP